MSPSAKTMKAALIWLPLLFAGCFIVQTFFAHKTMIGYGLTSNYIDENAAIIETRDKVKAEAVFENTVDVLKRNPLDVGALTQFVVSKTIIDPNTADMTIMQHVRKKNPRNRRAIKLSLWNAVKTNNVSLALAETDTLYKVDPDSRAQSIEVLSAIYKTEDGIAGIDERLKQDPRWAYHFLVNEIKKADSTHLGGLKPGILAYFSSIEDDSLKTTIISLFTKRFIDSYQYSAAHDFWKQNVAFNSDYSAQEFGLFNPELLTLNAPPPFNWSAFNNASVSTEFNTPNGVFTRFSKNIPATVLRQYFEWKPTNAIRLILDFRHKYEKNKGLYSINIRCAQNNELIVSHDLARSSTGGIEKIELSTTDQACRGVAYIDLRAASGEFPRPMVLTLNHLDIEFLDIIAAGEDE